MGEIKKIYLYNPVNNTKQIVNYDLLCGITGQSQGNLMSLKSKRKNITKIGCYIVDDEFTNKDLYNLMKKVKIKDEIWKDMEGFNGKYRISSYGRIMRIYEKSNKTKLMMPYTKKGKHKRWLVVKLAINGKSKEYAIHVLVANHFLENENDLPCVWHKNGNIQDNFAGNLKWVSRKFLGKKTAGRAKAMAVIKMDPETLEVLQEYESMAEAGRQNYLHRESIRLCVIGKSKTSGGFRWALKSDDYELEGWRRKMTQVRCNNCGLTMNEEDIEVNGQEEECCPNCKAVGKLMDLEGTEDDKDNESQNR